MSRGQTRLRILLPVCALIIAFSLFLGGGWQDPLSLLSADRSTILEIRFWRVGLGVIVGASLACAGAVLQTLLRNPLAEPYVLGVSAGSGLALALVLSFCTVLQASVWGLPLVAFAGGVASLYAVYALGRRAGTSSPYSLILAGVVWGSLCGSVLMFVVSQSSAEGLHTILWWFLGDLQIFHRDLVVAIAILNSFLLLALFTLARPLNAMALGDEVAGSLGLRPEQIRLVALSIAAALAASCVCVCGLLAFVGLVAPHAARSLTGADHRRLLPASALIGAAFVVLADGVGRTLLYPVEIPVGIFTSLVGAPFFLILLRQKQGAMWN